MPYTHAQEQLARQRIESRGLSFLVSKDIETQAKKMHVLLLKYPGSPGDDSGTNAPLYWNTEFEHIKAVNVVPKNRSESEPFIANLYRQKSPVENMPELECYGLFKYTNNSRAKIMISQNPKNSNLFICSINNHDREYRCGTLLVQIAIELSIVNGFNGKVALNSVRDSSQFYFKLGFLPEYRDVYEQLIQGKDINAGLMHLPKASSAAI